MDLMRSVAGDCPASVVLFSMYHWIRILSFSGVSPLSSNWGAAITPYKILWAICRSLTLF